MAVSRLVAVVAVLLLGGWPAAALVPELGDADVQAAVDAGTRGLTQEDFPEEWHLRPTGAEVVVSTPFSRLALAARQAAQKGEPLTAKQIQEQLERGRGRIQFVVTLVGRTVDFARWYQPLLRVGDREVKPVFVQNERTPLRMEDGRFAARNVYVFPLEGLPPRGTVVVVVTSQLDQKEVWRASLDLAQFR
ncbi:MAG TPA: hypothetical protein VLD61_03860 [Methylomirabilota bacterium]|nr:hypothetical protein [Methylomirabilota bacterium]